MESHLVRIRPVLPLLFLFAAIVPAQTIVPDQTTMTFSAPVGGSALAQDLGVTSTPSPVNLNATVVTYNMTGNWLAVSPTSAPTPAKFRVSVNASQLPEGVYSGAVTLTGTTNAVTVNVTLTVGNPTTNPNSSLAVTPATLTFTAQAGGLVPNAQLINVSSSPSAIGFAIAATTTDAFNWLQVPTNGTAPTAIPVSVNTAGMPAGMYSGTVTLSPSTGGAVIIPVTLNLTSGIAVSANVSSLQFFYQLGSFLPVPQFFSLSSGGAPLSVAITASTNDGNPWLNASPMFPVTPQQITVSISVGSLPAGVYTGKIHISAPAASNQSIDIPVTLTIASGPLLNVGATLSPFVAQTGAAAPPAQIIPLSSTGGTLSFTAAAHTQDGANWLMVSPSNGQTPQSLTVGVNSASLTPGNYTGTITITAPGASNSPVTIPVTLSVGNTSTLTVSSQALVLNYQIGGSNSDGQSQPLFVTSSGQSVAFTATATTTTCGANWLQVFPNSSSTPATLTVAIQPLGMNVPQVCTGVVTLTPATGAALQIAVTMNVSSTPLFNITPLALVLTAPFEGDPSAAQQIKLSVTDNSSVSFTATASTSTGGSSWLRVNQSSNTTPATISVSANPTNLNVGTYSGSITVSSSSLSTSQIIPITFKVTSTSNAVVSPASLSFTQVSGAPPPAAQSVTITATGPGVSFAATPSTTDLGQWLSVTPISGNTPGAISVSANGSTLSPGTYTGSVTLSLPGAANNSISIPVTLTVTSAASVLANPTSLTFSYRPGSTLPATQTLTASSTAGAVNVVASVSAGATWLSVTPSSGTSPATFTVAANPATLATGGYNATITLTPGTGSPVSVPVHLDVTSAAPSSIVAIANAASGVRGVVSPGEIVSLGGDSLGPITGVGLQLLADGSVSTNVAGTQVFFDNVAAPILFTSATQINTIVPYEVAGQATSQVVVVYQGVRTAPFTVQIASTAPGIFTSTQTGRGQGAVLNQDNTLNSSAIPAARGSVIQVFATGEGVTNPASITASVSKFLDNPVAKVTATIGGIPATVIYAGSAPGAVAGLLQVNLQVPQSVPPGDALLVLTIGNVSSQAGVTVAVK